MRVDVHHETGEVLVGPRMTLGAGGDEVLLRHLALGVGRRQDLVTAVTVRADGGLGGAEVGRLAVVAVQVGLQPFRVAARAERVDGSAESRSVRRGDVVRHVAIGADGRLAVGLAKHEVAVERATVHGEHVGVTVVARRELRRHQPRLRLVGPVQTGLEADMTARARQLAVAGGIVHPAVDEDAFLPAADVDGSILHVLLAVTVEAGVVAGGIERRLRGRGGGDCRGGEAERGRAAQERREQGVPQTRHGFTPLCWWQRSHIACG